MGSGCWVKRGGKGKAGREGNVSTWAGFPHVEAVVSPVEMQGKVNYSIFLSLFLFVFLPAFSPLSFFFIFFFFHFVYETGCTWIWKDRRQQKVNTTIYQSSRNICVHSTRTRMPSKASLKIHRETKSMPCPWVPPVFVDRSFKNILSLVPISISQTINSDF